MEIESLLLLLLLLFVSLKRGGYMTVSHFFTQSFAFLLNTARSFELQELGSITEMSDDFTFQKSVINQIVG